MADFQLDTSGTVEWWPRDGSECEFIHWPDLSPFAQGYGDAMAGALYARLVGGGWPPRKAAKAVAFRNWARETLARIMADCDAVAPDGDLNGYLPDNASAVADARGAGAEFWRRRNRLVFKRFPPLTPYLGDNGLIYLREAA